MNDFTAMLLMVVFFLGAGIIYAAWDICCRPAPTPEQVWVAQQRQECAAMNSRLTYDPQTRIARCFRTPFMRQPKLRFERKYL